jgi:peptide/nickel transport system substrate-binding protein
MSQTPRSNDKPDQPSETPALNRRQLLTRSAAFSSALLLPGLLAACGSGSGGVMAKTTDYAALAAEAGGPASRGGLLRVAMLGNGSSETYNPALANSFIDWLHVYSVYDPLIRPGDGFNTEPGLALAWTPNKDATVWEVKLRPGVVWHDGKPFTADDVIYTLRLMGDPAHIGHPAVINVRLRDLKKLDAHTLRIPLKQPNARLPDFFLYCNSSMVVQDGTKSYARPVGTGPYKLDSFTPGQRSTLSANRDYWEHGKPNPDQLQIISIDDNQARLNALRSGQVDVCGGLSPQLAKNIQSDKGVRLVVGQPGGAQPYYFVMRRDTPAFRDVRVRQAMRLICDRQQIIDVAMLGFATLGNDIWGKGLPLYDDSIPQRHQDLEQAKSLLKSAGATDLRLTLQATQAYGLIPPAELFAQQAKQAGVDVKVKRESGAAYFDPTQLWTKMPFAQGTWTLPSVPYGYSSTVVTGCSADEEHFRDAKFDAMFDKAVGTTAPEQQQQRWNDVQRNYHEQGGRIIWGSATGLDAVSPKVRGFGRAWLISTSDFRVWNWGLA